jgi:hypothetical protein
VPEVTTPRFRCGACGNLTRFDVTADRRTRSYHHYSVGGELHVEEEEVLSESIVEVTCRWCGHGRAIEVLDAGALDANVDAGEVGGSA